VESELASIAATRPSTRCCATCAFGPTGGAGGARQRPGYDRLGPARPAALPVQAERACAAFPGARLHWFDHSGHFPMLDEPDAALALIRSAVG
jgi:hypothetical protein